ncbi:MAG TPA: HDOD domain-containing protein [Candidatus Paceibacterota bacterium]|nr:HDOD domain-containing protein [Candidatus Paceibacterota bacterium]
MTANELVAKVKDLRVASQAALQLVNLLDRPDACNDDIVKILRYDNVLTAKLLRACNSSAFGFSEAVSSVDQAVFLLGHQKILQVVLALEFSATMTVPLAGYAVESKELWHHSLATASAAELLAKGGVEINADAAVAFTAGLLHDIGKLLMNQALVPEIQTEVRNRINEKGISRVEAEREVIGTDHAEAGAVLLQSWKLPEDIVEAVKNHHAPVTKPRPRMSALVHVADVVAHLAGSAPGWEAFAMTVDYHVTEAFDISPDRLQTLVMEVRDTFERVDEMMKMA